MKKTIILLITLVLFSHMLFGNESKPTYQNEILSILEEKGIISQWDENKKAEFILTLQQAKISPQVIRFVTGNLPADLDVAALGGWQPFLLAACLELDPLLKRGMEPARAKLLFRQYINSSERDSQNQKKMLKSYQKESSENPEAQYRNRQMYRYKAGRETAAGGGGGGGNQHGTGGNGGTGGNPADNGNAGNGQHQHQHGNENEES